MKSLTRWFGPTLALLALVASATERAEGATTTYTNQVAFQAAAGTTVLENFNSAAPFNTTGAFGPTAYNGFSLSGNGNGNNIGIHTGPVAFGGDNTPIPASFLGQNFFGWGDAGPGNTIGGVTFTFAQPTFAYGFDWFNTDQTDNYQITFNPAGGTFGNPPFTFATSVASSGFFGVTSTTAFTSAVITNLSFGGYISDEGFDNVQVGVNAVPEPATLASAATAILMALGYGWRRRKVMIAA